MLFSSTCGAAPSSCRAKLEISLQVSLRWCTISRTLWSCSDVVLIAFLWPWVSHPGQTLAKWLTMVNRSFDLEQILRHRPRESQRVTYSVSGPYEGPKIPDVLKISEVSHFSSLIIGSWHDKFYKSRLPNLF